MNIYLDKHNQCGFSLRKLFNFLSVQSMFAKLRVQTPSIQTVTDKEFMWDMLSTFFDIF